jgi:exocyst complex protein 7
MQFGELHAKQSLWTIPDQELRETLRLAIAEVLLPAYRSFVKRFGYLTSLFLIFYRHFTQLLHSL